jgi:oxalate decarboxylase
LAAAATLTVANAQDAKPVTSSADHHLPNESDPGPKNSQLEAENPDSVWSPETDRGTVPAFKYSFAVARKRVESGGCTRQVTARAREAAHPYGYMHLKQARLPIPNATTNID